MTQKVTHPKLGSGTLIKTYSGGQQWEVMFDSGRRYRLPSRDFTTDSLASIRQSQAERPTAAPNAPRALILDPASFGARQTLEALRVGIVPVEDAEHLTIGLESERVSLNRAVERSRDRGGDVLAVIGDYGYGKSHFIELAARTALKQNFIVASTSLDLVEVPPGKAHKIYESLVTALRYPDTDARGLAPLFRKALSQPEVIARFIALCPREPLTCPLAAALLTLQECDSQDTFDEAMRWLSGSAKIGPHVRACLKKPPRLYVTGEIARQYSYLLTGISTLARLVGYEGMAVLIDESEHYSLLGPSMRERADAFFKAMIYSALGQANGRISESEILEDARARYPLQFNDEPHMLFMFALTESDDRMPVGTWLSGSNHVRLDDRFLEKDIRLFFDTLIRYHTAAYSHEADGERFAALRTHAPGALYRALAQHRINLRQLIRAAIASVDLLYLHSDYATDDLLHELRRGLGV